MMSQIMLYIVSVITEGMEFCQEGREETIYREAGVVAGFRTTDSIPLCSRPLLPFPSRG